MKDDRTYLLHILDAAKRIQKYTKDGELAFQSDDKTQDAVGATSRSLARRRSTFQRMSRANIRRRHGRTFVECETS